MAAPKAKLRSQTNGLHKFAVQFVRDPRETSQQGHHVRQGIIYNDWMLKQTHNHPHLHHFIKLDAGVVKIKVEGLYYVYAQVRTTQLIFETMTCLNIKIFPDIIRHQLRH